jgi:opacity protein-like surface antigen
MARQNGKVGEMKRKTCGVLAAAAAMMLLPAGLAAQTASGGWDHSLMIYMLGAGMDGTVTVGPVAADVNIGFSDILKNLQFGAMASYRGEHGDFAILGDLIYMGLGATKHGPGDVKADVNVDQWVVELDAAWRLSPGFEVLGGARFVSLATDVALLGPLETRQAGVTKEWVDPVVGFQVKAPLGGAWTFVGRGDVGGFGIGSKLAWQALAGVRVELSPRSSLLLAYRALDEDYESGSGAGYFRYDVLTQGPMLGWKFTL